MSKFSNPGSRRPQHHQAGQILDFLSVSNKAGSRVLSWVFKIGLVTSDIIDSRGQHKGTIFPRYKALYISTDCTVEKLAEVFQGSPTLV
jgi:hypothetical protein